MASLYVLMVTRLLQFGGILGVLSCDRLRPGRVWRVTRFPAGAFSGDRRATDGVRPACGGESPVISDGGVRICVLFAVLPHGGPAAAYHLLDESRNTIG